MKQQISIEQWNELTEGQKYKFGSVFRSSDMPTIGQMIEFLTESKDVYLHIYWDWPWIVCLDGNTREREDSHRDFRGEDLCDCLFSAVKEVLEKK